MACFAQIRQTDSRFAQQMFSYLKKSIAIVIPMWLTSHKVFWPKFQYKLKKLNYFVAISHVAIKAYSTCDHGASLNEYRVNIYFHVIMNIIYSCILLIFIIRDS